MTRLQGIHGHSALLLLSLQSRIVMTIRRWWHYRSLHTQLRGEKVEGEEGPRCSVFRALGPTGKRDCALV